MNAPTTIKPPQSTVGLPLNLVAYKDGEFDKMHAAGSMMVSASSVAAIFNKLPASRGGRLSYAMHLNGKKPFADIGDEPVIQVGHMLEPLVATLLGKELGVSVIHYDAYARHGWLPLFATPDRVIEVDSELAIVEIKVVTPKAYWSDWDGGDRRPIHVDLQHQTQFACTGAKRGYIAVFDLGYCKLKLFETVPVKAAIQKIELGVDSFMATLDRGDMPAPDDTEKDFEAFRRLMSLSHEKERIDLTSDEAERRALDWLQAKADGKQAKATYESTERWFQRRLQRAEFADIATEYGPDLEVEWKTCARAKGANGAYRTFKIKEMKGQNDE